MKLFYELIQVALGNKDRLSETPSETEWCKLYDIAQEQAVAGLAFIALDKLSMHGQKPPLDLLFEWIGLSEQIKQRNAIMNIRCEELQQRLTEEGFRSSILKGQGVAKYYDKGLCSLRQPGDIDVFIDCGRKKAIEIAKEWLGEPVDWDYKHLHLRLWDDVEIEMHYRVEVLLNLVKNVRLQKWFKAHEDDIFENQDGMVTPTVEFNVFYILLHIYRHFLFEGVGLRQFMDYYFVLKKYNEPPNYNSDLNRSCIANDAIKEFGMERFACGVMWVLGEVFAMNPNMMICEPSEKEGRFILHKIMDGGNFGHYDPQINHKGGGMAYVTNVIRHNFHIFTHYPSDTIWAPVWLVWHKCWKLTQSV